MTGAEQYPGGTLYGLFARTDDAGDAIDVYRCEGRPGVTISTEGPVQLGPDDSNELAIALAGETGPAPDPDALPTDGAAVWALDMLNTLPVAVAPDGAVRLDGVPLPGGAETLREAALVLLAAAARSEQARRG